MQTKYKLILLFGPLILLGLSEYNQPVKIITETQINLCPETDGTEIFALHGILTSSKLQTKWKRAGIETYSIKKTQDELLKLPNLQEFLHDYWQTKGVEKVSSPEICQRISEVLHKNPRSERYFKKYRAVYFKIKNKYIIIYQRKQIGTENVKVPWQVLNQEFELLGDFRI